MNELRLVDLEFREMIDDDSPMWVPPARPKTMPEWPDYPDRTEQDRVKRLAGEFKTPQGLALAYLLGLGRE